MTRVAPDPRAAERPDTFDMRLVHRVFRRELHLLPELVRAVPAGDSARAAIVAGHQRHVLGLLQHHQRGEEALIWPKVRRRARLADELAAALARHSEDVHERIARCAALGDSWEAAPAAAPRGALAEALDELARAVETQLTAEERELVPLIGQHLSAAEWNELGDSGQQGRSKRDLLLTLGLMLEDASREDEAKFLAKLPFPAGPVWRLHGRAWYGRYTRRVRRA